jgi:hypothetical protein
VTAIPEFRPTMGQIMLWKKKSHKQSLCPEKTTEQRGPFSTDMAQDH